MSNPLIYFSHDSLRTFTTDIFKKLDLSSEDAALVSDCLVKADLRGLGSHGVARIPLYAKRLRLKTGIPLSSEIVDMLRKEADDEDVPFPKPIKDV